MRIRDIFVSSNHHVRQAFESWTGSSPFARSPGLSACPGEPPPPTTPPPPPNKSCSTSPQKRVTREPQELGAGAGRGNGVIDGRPFSFAPLRFRIFRGRPTTCLIGPGEGATVPRHRVSLGSVGCSKQPHQMCLRKLTERVAAMTGIEMLGHRFFPYCLTCHTFSHLRGGHWWLSRAIVKYLDIHPTPDFFFLAPAACGNLAGSGVGRLVYLHPTHLSRDDSVVRPSRSTTGGQIFHIHVPITYYFFMFTSSVLSLCVKTPSRCPGWELGQGHS